MVATKQYVIVVQLMCLDMVEDYLLSVESVLSMTEPSLVCVSLRLTQRLDPMQYKRRHGLKTLSVPKARAVDGDTWTREDGVVFIYNNKQWERLDAL